MSWSIELKCPCGSTMFDIHEYSVKTMHTSVNWKIVQTTEVIKKIVCRYCHRTIFQGQAEWDHIKGVI